MESYIEPAVAAQARVAPPVLALGGGITLAAVLNILGRNGLPYFALCPPGDFVRLSRWYRPLPTRLSHPEPSNLEHLLSTLDLESAFLLPCSDDWLRAVARLPASLAARFPSNTPWSCVEVLTDKWRFAELLRGLGVPHPRTQLIASSEALASVPDSCFEGAILKPLSSVTFSIRHGVKGYLVQNRRQVDELLRRVELPIMLQELIPGPPTAGYFLDGYRDRTGRVAALLGRQRLRMRPALLGNSTLVKSVPLSSLREAIAPLEHLLECISYRGIFSAEFKYDERDHEFKLIEINARPWWYIEFAELCGVDVCRLAYQDAMGQPVSAIPDYAIGRQGGLLLHDLRAWKACENQCTSLFSLLKTWATARSTPFHKNDPLPALRYFWSSMSQEPSRPQPVRPRLQSLPEGTRVQITTAGK
jgi:D-aspartate ligase